MSAVLAGLAIATVGGDRRTEYYLPSLLQAGAKILAVGLARLPCYLDVVPVDLLAGIRTCHVALLPMAGMDARGRVQSFYDDAPLVLDHLAYLNSVPTAEGAVRLAQDRAVKTIHGSRALVVGYGRCGITLAALLKGRGAHVTVAARQGDALAKAFAAGHSPQYAGEMPRLLGSFDFLFNTAPALVFTEDLLVCMRRDSVLIDIASGAGGVDCQAAKQLGRVA